MTIDAGNHFKGNSFAQSSDENLSDDQRSAIFWTGAHHARELITI